MLWNPELQAQVTKQWTELVAFALLFFVSTIDARAQVRAGIAVGASRQAGGASDLPYLGPPFGGTSIAMLAMVDVPLGSRGASGARRASPVLSAARRSNASQAAATRS